MSALAFDTHAFIKRLAVAGMPEAQAEVLADQQTKLIDEKLTTKDDLAKLELRLDSMIEAAKSEIIKWIFGSIGFQTLIIIGAVIALARVVRP